MNIGLPTQIDRKQWLGFLRVKGEPAQRLATQMEEAERQLLAAAQPRGIYRVLPREEAAVEGASIRRHLEGCDQVAVMAVTLGSQIDQLIARTQVTNMAMAVVLDAGASVLAEQTADRAEQIIRAELTEKLQGRFFTARFSPGYGDYPVRYQREILACVDAHRKIGITLTGGDMMVPHKSVTALIGLADHPVTGRLATCAECVLRDKCDAAGERLCSFEG